MSTAPDAYGLCACGLCHGGCWHEADGPDGFCVLCRNDLHERNL
jgi:hypothetical protein